MLRTFAVCLPLILAAGPASAAPTACELAEEPDAILAECTKEIDAGTLQDKGLAAAHGRRGYAHEQKKNWDPALAELDKAVALDSGHKTAYYVRARVYDALGKYAEELADLNRAIELEDHPKFAYVYRGKTYVKLGQLDNAFADFNKALSLDGELYDALLNRGLAYETSGDLDKAIADFSSALKAEEALVAETEEFFDEEDEPPRYVLPYFYLGRAYEAKGDLDSAYEAYLAATSNPVSKDDERVAQEDAKKRMEALQAAP